MIRDFVKDNQVALIVVGTVVGAVAVSLILTGGDLGAFGEFFLKLF